MDEHGGWMEEGLKALDASINPDSRTMCWS